MKKIVLCLLFVSFAVSAFGQGRNFEAEDTPSGIIIKDYIGTSKDVVIPDEVNGKPIIAIRDGAFKEKQLLSVKLGKNIATIGKEAFARNQISEVIIPESVTSIGEDAFRSNRITKVTIPNGTVIRGNAFGSNQIVEVNIGVNVSIIANSLGGIGFELFYNNNSKKAAGTYVRENTNVTTWTKGVFTF